jgi:hypothetical protein
LVVTVKYELSSTEVRLINCAPNYDGFENEGDMGLVEYFYEITAPIVFNNVPMECETIGAEVAIFYNINAFDYALEASVPEVMNKEQVPFSFEATELYRDRAFAIIQSS